MKISRLIICLILFVVLSAPVRAQNWTIIDSSVTHTTAALRSAFFTNSTTGYIVGGNDSGVILKTSDAGNSWNLTVVNKYLECVYFPSDSVGYAVGSAHTIMKTTDAGATWVYQFAPSLSSLYTAMSVCFINNDTGFIGLKNGPGYAFLKTYNGGATWINDISDTVHANVFFKINDSTVCGVFGEFSKTTNKGVNWINYSIPPNTNLGSSLFFTNETEGFATLSKHSGDPCFNYSSLIKTTDGGQTWTETNYDCDYVDGLYFPSAQIGYMVGGYIGSPRAQKIWKTIDGGNVWEYTTFQLDSFLTANNVYGSSIFCTDVNTCYILTNYGIIVKTTNGGGTDWTVSVKEEKKAVPQFVLYPNPAQLYITIEYELLETKDIEIEIKNMLGQTVKTVKSKNLIQGQNKIEVDVSELATGIYCISLRGDKQNSSVRFIKQ